MPADFNNKTKRFAFWLILAIDVGLISAWALLTTLTWNQLSSAQKSLPTESQINYVALKHFIEETVEKRAMVAEAVVTTDSSSAFIDHLSALASAAGVSLKINRADNASAGLILNLSARGSFKGVVQFLRLIENLPVKLTINKESLTLQDSGVSGRVQPTPAGATASTGRWQAEVELKILSYRK